MDNDLGLIDRVQYHAQSDADFDGRTFFGLSKADRERYIARATLGYHASRNIPQTNAIMLCSTTFGGESAGSRIIRGHRFIEEAVELVQATGISKREVLDAVNYVYSRPVGEVGQEIGGVFVTLMCLAGAEGESVDECGESELKRFALNIDTIRAKSKLKPTFGKMVKRTLWQKIKDLFHED